MRRPNSDGFTIIELMIATTVFSVVLLICAFALLQIGRTYYKGVTSNKTQEAARTVTDEISRAIQFSGSDPVVALAPNNGSQGFCINDRRYSYKLNQQLVDSDDPGTHQGNHVLLVDNLAGCTGGTGALDVDNPGAGSFRELLSENMRLNKLTLTKLADQFYELQVRVVYGNDDVLNNDQSACQDVRVGTQFCAVSELTTKVQKRLQ